MMKKSILLPILTLAIVAAVLLAATFGLHAITEANAQKIHRELMKTLIPGSEEITLEPYTGDDANIRSVHKGETGFVIETVTAGYAGDITMFIGVANDGTITYESFITKFNADLANTLGNLVNRSIAMTNK